MALNRIVIEPEQKANACIIWLHGLGANGHDFAEMPALLNLTAAGIHARFVFPHAPSQPVTVNGGASCPAWFDILSLGNSITVDEVGLAKMDLQIRAMLEEACQLVGAHRVFIAGFSQGAAMALFSAFHYSQALAGVLLLSGCFPQVARLPKKTTPIFQAHGTLDPVITLEAAQKTYLDLEKAGFSVVQHLYPMGHSVCEEEVNAIRHWIVQRF